MIRSQSDRNWESGGHKREGGGGGARGGGVAGSHRKGGRQLVKGLHTHSHT